MTDRPKATEIEVERRGSAVVIHVRGELDALAGPQLEDAALRVMEEGATHCIIDLSGSTFIDSIGVGALIRAHRNAGSHNSKILISGPHGMIAQLIKVTQLDRIFAVFPNVDSALSSIARPADQ